MASRGLRNIRWIESMCRIPDGKLVGRPVRLTVAQKKWIRAIYDTPTRTFILSMARKNAKAATSAFLLLLHLCGPEAKPNSQLYSAAQSRDQAAILFGYASKVVRMSPDLSEYSMASNYLRLISKPTRGDMERMHAALVSAAEARGHTEVNESVTLAMAWLMDPRCKVCNGAGLVARNGKDHKCPKCKGEKFRKEPSDMLAMGLITYVQECRRAHSSRIFKRLH